jgi:uncharacterized protein (DUF1330 family)
MIIDAFHITGEVRKHDPTMNEDYMTICKSLIEKHGNNYQV